jgi:hypothetical protein
MGGGSTDVGMPTKSISDVATPTTPSVVTDNGGITNGGKNGFPMPDGAINITNIGGSTNFQVKMSLAEAMKFYKDAFTKSGYKERAILTVTSDTTFSMVFDGHKSGKAIVIQGVDMKDGSVNINICLESV